MDSENHGDAMPEREEMKFQGPSDSPAIFVKKEGTH